MNFVTLGRQFKRAPSFAEDFSEIAVSSIKVLRRRGIRSPFFGAKTLL